MPLSNLNTLQKTSLLYRLYFLRYWGWGRENSPEIWWPQPEVTIMHLGSLRSRKTNLGSTILKLGLNPNPNKRSFARVRRTSAKRSLTFITLWFFYYSLVFVLFYCFSSWLYLYSLGLYICTLSLPFNVSFSTLSQQSFRTILVSLSTIFKILSTRQQQSLRSFLVECNNLWTVRRTDKVFYTTYCCGRSFSRMLLRLWTHLVWFCVGQIHDFRTQHTNIDILLYY